LLISAEVVAPCFKTSRVLSKLKPFDSRIFVALVIPALTKPFKRFIIWVPLYFTSGKAFAPLISKLKKSGSEVESAAYANVFP